MQKILFLLIFFSTSSFAHTLILSKRVTSGNVEPQNSFVKDCKVYKEGFATIRIKAGTSATRTHTHQVSRQRVLTIQSLLRVARNGEIETVGAQCDGGDNLLNGYIRGEKILLDENVDCGDHKVNQSPATPSLARQALRICGF